MPVAKVLVSSRVYMPAKGGQTIALPRLMEDVLVLWAPLTRQETPAHVPAVDQRAVQWLPASEEDATRRYLYRLSRTQSDFVQKIFKRAAVYLPDIVAELKKQRLPLALACLPLVESAFEPRAVSHAGAAGLWQLMPRTARRYGLEVSEKVDERFHVPKATKAALAYLAFLYKSFNDWPLALAAYNCGEGAMRRALERSGSSSLNELSRASRRNGLTPPLLVEETVQYVPKFVAALTVMTQSRELGLTERPLLEALPPQKTRPPLKTDREEEHARPVKEPSPPKSRRIQ